MVDLTDEMIDRAATALMAREAEQRLTDIYGRVSRDRARVAARSVLESALDLHIES
jgi:hypothetical protein